MEFTHECRSSSTRETSWGADNETAKGHWLPGFGLVMAPEIHRISWRKLWFHRFKGKFSMWTNSWLQMILVYSLKLILTRTTLVAWNICTMQHPRWVRHATKIQGKPSMNLCWKKMDDSVAPLLWPDSSTLPMQIGMDHDGSFRLSKHDVCHYVMVYQHVFYSTYGAFLKWGHPQLSSIYRCFFPYKPSSYWGLFHLWKPP